MQMNDRVVMVGGKVVTVAEDPVAQAIVDRKQRLRDRALSEGLRMTQFIFARRGNHREVHLGKSELSAILAAAWEHGYEFPTIE